MNHWRDPFSFFQLIAWPAFFLYLMSYQLLDPRKTIRLWIPANIFMAVHFYGMGSIPALCIALGAMVRDSVAVYGSKKTLSYTLVAYVIYAWVAVLLSADAVQDYLVAVGTTFLSLATFNRDFFWRHRLFSACHQVMWFSAFVLMGSYAGVTQLAFLMTSNMVGMLRRFLQK